jgi:hypothetical protein
LTRVVVVVDFVVRDDGMDVVAENDSTTIGDGSCCVIVTIIATNAIATVTLQ